MTSPEHCPGCGPVVAPHPDTWAWLAERAALFFDGSVPRTVEHLLDEAYRRHLYYASVDIDPADPPFDPWGALMARVPPPGVRGPVVGRTTDHPGGG